MASSQNALPGGVQQPLFAPVSQAVQADDIDLNEIFAEYFISEFDDPLNAYTSSMANYGGAAAAVAISQQQQHQVPAFLANAASPAPAPADATPAPAPFPAVGNSNPSYGAATTTVTPFPVLPTGGIKTAFHSGAQSENAANFAQQQLQPQEPLAKKPKQEESDSGVTVTAVQGQIAIPTLPIGTGALSGRLGFSLLQAQAALPLAQPPATVKAVAPAVPLPVGVGIKLGGIGGVAPTTAAQAPVAARPVIPGGQFATMWGVGGGMIGAGGIVSDHAIAERRQRNREHAKRSRVRKKFMLESLQCQVRKLQKENSSLRILIQEKIPQKALQIISECCKQSPLFSDQDDMDDGTDTQPSKKSTTLVGSDFTLIESLTSGQQNFVLSDPRLPDNPIVYASPGFYQLTGYTSEHVLGRNCRFLQGPGTDPRVVDVIRTAVASGSDCTVCILNYKADGTPFWNQFFLAALRDADNCIVNYVGVQCEVEPEAGASALEEKVNAVLPLNEKDGDDDDD